MQEQDLIFLNKEIFHILFLAGSDTIDANKLGTPKQLRIGNHRSWLLDKQSGSHHAMCVSSTLKAWNRQLFKMGQHDVGTSLIG